MDFISIFLIAIGLAMDAFAVSVSNGILIKKITLSVVLRFGLFFGAFQFAMPIIGWRLGITFSDYIADFDHWIAFGLLSLIGGKMLFDIYQEGKEGVEHVAEAEEAKILSLGNMTMLAIATSIDAMAVGVSFAVIDTNIWAASFVIGVVAFVLSVCGVLIGKKLGDVFKKGATLLGAIILISIAFKILIEHLFFQ